MVILDLGSGNTCQNDQNIIKKMIDEINKVVEETKTDKKEIVLKWQMFKEAGENIPLSDENFCFAYVYARDKGFETTASIFDYESLREVLKYKIPFIKLANNIKSQQWINHIPRGTACVISVSQTVPDIVQECAVATDIIMGCISEYPAKIEDYEKNYSEKFLRFAISDHTEGIELYQKYKPKIWEKHFKLDDSTGLDAGSFAITHKELKKVLTKE